MSAYAKLRRRRQIFVDAYVRTGVGTEAALKSGYSGKAPSVAAAKIMANPEVKAAIAERTEEAIARAGVRTLRVLEEAALMAYARISHLRGADGKLLAFKDWPEEFLAGASSISFNDDGTVKNVKLAKEHGVNGLMRYLKLLTDVHEHTGKDGGPIETKDVSDLEKARRIGHLLAQGLRAQASATDPDDSPDSVSGNAG